MAQLRNCIFSELHKTCQSLVENVNTIQPSSCTCSYEEPPYLRMLTNYKYVNVGFHKFSL